MTSYQSISTFPVFLSETHVKYVKVEDSTDLRMSADSDFSLSYYVKRLNENTSFKIEKTGLYSGNVNYYLTVSGNFQSFGFEDTSDDGYWIRYAPNCKANSAKDMVVCSENYGVSPAGEWTHVLGVKSGEHYKIYINGQLMGDMVTEYAPSSGAQTLNIGNGSGDYEDSDVNNSSIVDDVRVYNRALNSDEVKKLYSIKGINERVNDGLIAHYEFEDSVVDSSGNDRNGSAEGGITYSDGVLGKAINFNGADTRVTFDYDELKKIEDATSYSMWVRVDDGEAPDIS